MTAAVTISIDLELAWGNWDDITSAQIDRIDQLERQINSRLIELFDRYEVPVTWAIVAALLDRDSALGRPGYERHWYAPDVIEYIVSAKTRHDIGSHSGRHIYFDRVSEEEARADLAFAREIHQRAGLDFTSFVYPRNRVARADIIGDAGLKVYRGEDWAWHQWLRRRSVHAGRIANLIDKILPIAPEPVWPTCQANLTDLAGSMLFLGRNGLRRMVGRDSIAAKLTMGMDSAEHSGGVFHLWFHPSNFYHRTDEQFAVFETFLVEASNRRETDRLEIKPMAAYV